MLAYQRSTLPRARPVTGVVVWLNSAQATPQSVAPPTDASPQPVRHLTKTTQHRSGGLHYTRTPRRANAYSDGWPIGRAAEHTSTRPHATTRAQHGYSLRYPIYIWDIQIGYSFPGPPYAIVFAYTDTCETLGRSGRTLRVILSSKSELGNLIRAQQRARRTVAARRHCVGGAVATTMAGSWWGSL